MKERTYIISKQQQYVQNVDLKAGRYTINYSIRTPNTSHRFAFLKKSGGWQEFEMQNLTPGKWHRKDEAKLSFYLLEDVVAFDLCTSPASVSSPVMIQKLMLEEGLNASTAKPNELDLLESIEDLFDMEHIFKPTENLVQPETPESLQQDDYTPEGWDDDPVTATYLFPYVWHSFRQRIGDVWGAFYPPTLYSNYSKPGEDVKMIEIRGGTSLKNPDKTGGVSSTTLTVVKHGFESSIKWEWLYQGSWQATSWSSTTLVVDYSEHASLFVNDVAALRCVSTVNPEVFTVVSITAVWDGEDGHSPYIGGNGNWFVWDSAQNKYVDSGDSAQGDDGKSPEIRDGYWWAWDGTDWYNTGVKAEGKDGQDGHSPYIGENGNWWVWDSALKKYVDSGDSAQGDDGKSPEIRDGYWWAWDGTKWYNTGVKAEGKDGITPVVTQLVPSVILIGKSIGGDPQPNIFTVRHLDGSGNSVNVWLAAFGSHDGDVWYPIEYAEYASFIVVNVAAYPYKYFVVRSYSPLSFPAPDEVYWNTPYLLSVSVGMYEDGKDGLPGIPGQVPVQKEWVAGDMHRNSDEIVDYIYVRGSNSETSYWYQLIDKTDTEGIIAGGAPTGGAIPAGYKAVTWMPALAAKTLIAEEANLANLIFKEGKLISIKGNTFAGEEINYGEYTEYNFASTTMQPGVDSASWLEIPPSTIRWIRYKKNTGSSWTVKQGGTGTGQWTMQFATAPEGETWYSSYSANRFWARVKVGGESDYGKPFRFTPAGGVDFIPNIIIDGKTGKIYAEGAEISGVISALSGKVGVLTIEESGRVVLTDPDTHAVRLVFSEFDIPLIADLVSGANDGGYASNAAKSNITVGYQLPNAITVGKNNSSIAFSASTFTVNANIANMMDYITVNVYLRKNGVNFTMIKSVQLYGPGSKSENTSITYGVDGVGTGTYDVFIEIRKTNALDTVSSYISASTLSWTYTQAGIRYFQFGVNGMMAFFSDNHWYFTETGGLDLKGKTNMPGVLAAGSSTSGGIQSNVWGAKSSTANITPITGGFRVPLSGLSHSNYVVQITPHTNTTFRVGTKTSTYFEVHGTGGFDYVVIGNNY